MRLKLNHRYLLLAGLSSITLGLQPCQVTQANPLKPPDPKENIIRQTCVAELTNLYYVIQEYKHDLDDELLQKVTSLVIAAEIDSQFQSFPTCFNKLERAKWLLIQSEYEVPPLPQKNGY